MRSILPRSRSPRSVLALLAALGLAGTWGCGAPPEDAADDAGSVAADDAADPAGPAMRVSFDGADYGSEEEMLAHGERLSTVFGCNACHLEDYTGTNFGELIPLVEGLWATNISLTMPTFSDEELERLLREGVHPTREIYLMPSKQTQFLGARDMDALIAHLRTVEPAGEPTPPPPPGFEDAVTARLPDDYWRASLEDAPRAYHNAEEEARYFAENAPPDLGEETTQGRLIAVTVCSSCHGAALDGVGEPAGDIQGALDYDEAAFQRLLREGVGLDGETVTPAWSPDHLSAPLTDGEIRAAIAYTKLLAERRAEG